jgi:hypothetical protein
VLFVLTKIAEGFRPIIDSSAKVIALEFQVAVGQNCG